MVFTNMWLPVICSVGLFISSRQLTRESSLLTITSILLSQVSSLTNKSPYLLFRDLISHNLVSSHDLAPFLYDKINGFFNLYDKLNNSSENELISILSIVHRSVYMALWNSTLV